MTAATPNDWAHFDFELGLGGNLLPCVPFAADLQIAPGSSLSAKTLGKIPSQFNQAGQVHGIKEWQKRAIDDAEVALWSRDARLNMCVRTGPISGLYAIDVDVEDTNTNMDIVSVLREVMPEPSSPMRERPNSNKFLMPFWMDEICKKRIIKLDREPKGPRIELLADGQQFVAVGRHSSGVAYSWDPALPSSFPRLTLVQVDTLFNALADTCGVTPIAPQSSTTGTGPADLSTLTQISDIDWANLIQALKFLLDKVSDNDSWSKIGYALLGLAGSGKPARQLWLDFSRKATGYEPGAPEAWWNAHAAESPRCDFRTIFKMAHDAGFHLRAAPDSFPITAVAPPLDQCVDSIDAAADVCEPPAQSVRPLIRITDEDYALNLKQMDETAYPVVYTQGNALTRLGHLNLDDDIRRNTDQVSLVPLSKGWVRPYMSTTALFQRYDAKREDWRECKCPLEILGEWMDQGDWPALRPLDAVARSPFVRTDGSICEATGYDKQSRALYMPSGVYPPMGQACSREDAQAAAERLVAPFDQFPWGTPGSRSTFLAHILSEVSRLALDRCPMFWYSAHTAGTGKSLLSEMASTIVHGTEPSMRPWVSDGDELRKTLFASLLAGDRSIAFDNVPTAFKARAPELCAFITSNMWQDRRLGVSETISIPNRAVVSASGNNVTPVGDLARRSLVVRLDGNSEKLKARTFKIKDLRTHVLENRPQMLIDALTIIQAYALAGKPMEDQYLLDSFERWSRLVRQPMLWLNWVDPCETQADETDDETHELKHIFEALHTAFGTKPFTCVDISKLVGSMLDAEGALHTMLVNSGCQEPSSQKSVGYWIRTVRDKTAADLKLIHCGVSKFGARWQLQPINSSEDLA